MRQKEIKQGILRLPNKVLEVLHVLEGSHTHALIEEFWEKLWHNFLREKETSSLVWYDKFSDKELYNKLLILLSKAGWINSKIEVAYASIMLSEDKLLKWVTKEELIEIKRDFKFLKYRMVHKKAKHSDRVKLSHTISKTGLIREGFRKAGNHKFSYDTFYLTRYISEIAENVCKGLKASNKDVSYEEVICELLGYYSSVENEYSLGENVSDSRGRAIYEAMRKVFNPISSKDARALLLMEPHSLEEEDFEEIFLAIAELYGVKAVNQKDKINKGIELYENKALPSLEDMRIKQDYSALHNRIWLERLYSNLDNYNGINWVTPIDLDATASMLEIIGALTNNHFYLSKTNVIGEELEDIWTIDKSEIDISREHIKKALQPQLYGSSKTAKQLWTQNKLSFTQAQVNFVNKELEKGRYATANKFKEFIIKNVQPEKIMKISIWKDTFFVECNRFKWEKTSSKSYNIYSTKDNRICKVNRDFNLSPDLNQFKRFFVTLLCHNLDSQIADTICKEVDFVLPNHDAFIVSPREAKKVKEIYVRELYEIYRLRKEILSQYFNSIGITEEYREEDNHLIDEFLTTCLK